MIGNDSLEVIPILEKLETWPVCSTYKNCPVFLVCPASQYLATCWQKYPVRLRQTLRKKADACACSVYPALSPPLKGPGDEARNLLLR